MKKFLKITGLTLTIFITVLYLASCVTPYISPERFTPAAMLSLAYLPLLITYTVLIAVWFFVRKRISLLLFILLFTGYKNMHATVGTNVFRSPWKWEKDTGVLRVMCWNINYLGDPWIVNDTPGNIRRQMLEYIAQIQPDILCVQDFTDIEEITVKSTFRKNLAEVYRYGKFIQHSFPFSFDWNGNNYRGRFGAAIFSRLPATDTGSFINGGHRPDERSAYVDVKMNGKTLRLYAAHLSSMQLWPSTTGEAGLRYFEGDNTKERTSATISKLNYYGRVHAKEATNIKEQLNKSPYPFLFSGDLNSVPSSYVYHTLKKNLRDAFLDNDYGIGGTYNRVFPKLRIDVLFHSKDIEVVQYTRPATDLSDHYPIIADIRWKK